MKKKIVVVGLGEIGRPIYQLISKITTTVGFDTNSQIMDKKVINKYYKLKTSSLHICIPFTKNFSQNVFSLCSKFDPEFIVIHSTISPNTTKTIQKKLAIPVIYSATRGVHKRMISDLKRYTKFFAIERTAPRRQWAVNQFKKLMKNCKIKTKQMTNPLTLELAKIVVDTSYYGWLINYAQLSNMIAIKNRVNYNEMWSFADEIQRFLGDRPKMFPGFIGGHCIIPNLDLINNEDLNLIKEINLEYEKILKRKSKKKAS